jgi:hypothetical protein
MRESGFKKRGKKAGYKKHSRPDTILQGRLQFKNR